MLSPPEAEAAIARSVPAAPQEILPLESLAGKVLQQAVFAERDQPPFHRVSMDGVALASDAWAQGVREFAIMGVQPAGAPQLALPDSRACIEVMTGAVLPLGCDCVIPVEKLERMEARVRLTADVVASRWLNVHQRGSDSLAGDQLLAPGIVLRAPEVAIVASAGLATAVVAAQPRIMVISTGDELVEPGDDIEDWQIRRSNAYAVVAALQRRGYTTVAHDHLPDDLKTLRDRLRVHLDTHDTLILSGGVSMGRFDFVPEVLAELGVTTIFHKVAQRPGKPLWFGVRNPGKAVYALPGNPVSTLVSCIRYVIPGIEASLGAERTARGKVVLQSDVPVPAGLAVFLPVQLTVDATGRQLAIPKPTRGSGDFISLTGTDGFVELEAGPRTAMAGTLAPFYPW
jgi:molybdopterin molybdotransferase